METTHSSRHVSGSLLTLCSAFVCASCLWGCPAQPVKLSEIKPARLLVATTAGARFCVNEPAQIRVVVVDEDGLFYRTWASGEDPGGRLRFTDFSFDSDLGTIDESGMIHVGDPLAVLSRPLVIDVAARTQDTETFLIRTRVSLAPRFDCSARVSFDGKPGMPGNSGSAGTDGLAGEDLDSCGNAENGTNAQDGDPGQAGTDGADARDLAIELALTSSFWRQYIIIVKAVVIGDEPKPVYRFLPVERLGDLVVSVSGAAGGDGGSGGTGGTGGNGGSVACKGGVPGNGGNGGSGGDGGSAGDGGNGGGISVLYDAAHPEIVQGISFVNEAGKAGKGGPGGRGGKGGRAGEDQGARSGFHGHDGQSGETGKPGEDGHPGPEPVLRGAERTELLVDEQKQGLILK